MCVYHKNSSCFLSFYDFTVREQTSQTNKDITANGYVDDLLDPNLDF
jgi:hypothetical protein